MSETKEIVLDTHNGIISVALELYADFVEKMANEDGCLEHKQSFIDKIRQMSLEYQHKE